MMEVGSAFSLTYTNTMKKKILQTVVLYSAFLFVLIVPFSSVLAQFRGTTGTGNANTTGTGNANTTGTGNANTLNLNVKLNNPISTNTFQEFVQAALDIVLKIGIPVVALFIIYSGFLFVTARGNADKLKTAKTTFIYTCLGAAVLLGAWVIANAIAGTINEIRN
jgi:hypothetical protein